MNLYQYECGPLPRYVVADSFGEAEEMIINAGFMPPLSMTCLGAHILLPTIELEPLPLLDLESITTGLAELDGEPAVGYWVAENAGEICHTDAKGCSKELSEWEVVETLNCQLKTIEALDERIQAFNDGKVVHPTIQLRIEKYELSNADLSRRYDRMSSDFDHVKAAGEDYRYQLQLANKEGVRIKNAIENQLRTSAPSAALGYPSVRDKRNFKKGWDSFGKQLWIKLTATES